MTNQGEVVINNGGISVASFVNEGLLRHDANIATITGGLINTATGTIKVGTIVSMNTANTLTIATGFINDGLIQIDHGVAGIFLAWSTDRVADITGVASSTLGILAVSVVTTLPELSSTLAAVRMGAVDLGVAGLFGSAVFNASVLAYADPFYRGGVLVNQTEGVHIIAGCVAVGLILAALVLVMGRNRISAPVAMGGLVLMAGAWLAAAGVVGTLGAA